MENVYERLELSSGLTTCTLLIRFLASLGAVDALRYFTRHELLYESKKEKLCFDLKTHGENYIREYCPLHIAVNHNNKQTVEFLAEHDAAI